jgi:3-hydroxybutyryl-CoA dehydratase
MVEPHPSGGYILDEVVVGTILPGAGAIYLGQTLNFHKPVRIGEDATARVTVATIDHAAARVVLRCEVYVGRDLVMDGEATLRVPRRWRPQKDL